MAEVSSAISSQNVQISAGELGALPNVAGQTISATITVEGQLSTAEQFGNIIVRSNTDGSNVYLKDVADIKLGSQDYSTATRLNGEPAVGMAVMLSNKGNAVATATAVRKRNGRSSNASSPATCEWSGTLRHLHLRVHFD